MQEKVQNYHKRLQTTQKQPHGEWEKHNYSKKTNKHQSQRLYKQKTTQERKRLQRDAKLAQNESVKETKGTDTQRRRNQSDRPQKHSSAAKR